ncbi:MAG: biotin-dependent carboxyltransferase family protein [Chitinophagaceae bacterium]
MNLRIIKSGVLDTVQDMGRYGSRYLGINPGGAMDKYAARIANSLVMNEPDAAVIEFHFPASAVFFEQPALIAVSGADFSPYVNGEPVPSLQPILLSKYSILQFERVIKGARGYLGIYGGMNIQPWLNSYSANLKIGIDGYLGKPLQANDEIGIQTVDAFTALLNTKEFIVLPWKADASWDNTANEEIKILPGPEWDRLDRNSQTKLLNESFTINNQSDRMGYQLSGPPLIQQSNDEMISSAVTFGTVQLLPDGQLIILMADHQATGGYPRIANVISAHHSRLAQARPGEKFQFVLSNQQEAEELFLKQENHLGHLRNACRFRLEQLLGSF